MKTLIFNIVKLLISVVFQYSIFVGTFLYCTLAGIEFYDIDTTVFWIIFILAFLLGEGGIFLLYSVKPLEKKRSRIIYTTFYMGINILSVVIFLLFFGAISGFFDNLFIGGIR
ncbi:MAG: hypothetical protein J6D02_01380 [Lachnospira sp.]|nr:hypothetical protein [Lachnospira sp.]